MLYLPQNIPASLELHTVTYKLDEWETVLGCKRVLLLNLMPQKAVTEYDIARVLQLTDKDIQLIPIKISGQQYKNTSKIHMDSFYLNFEEVENSMFDRLIITGAPLEQIDFEDVRYWDALCYIMEWSDQHVKRNLYICWAAQAGLYHFYNLPKYRLEQKMFGVFLQQVNYPQNPLMRNLGVEFPMPNSRHTEIRKEDVESYLSSELQIIAESQESGVGVLATLDLKRTFIVGHLEYAADTLHKEYWRDINKGLSINPPLHYYGKENSLQFSWKQVAISFYTNWIND